MTRAGERCASEFAGNPMFLDGDDGTSRSVQTMAPKSRVLEVTRDK
jgi:hypothetical protein